MAKKRLLSTKVSSLLPFQWPSFLPGIEKEANKKACIHFIDPGLGVPLYPAPETDVAGPRLMGYQIHFWACLINPGPESPDRGIPAPF